MTNSNINNALPETVVDRELGELLADALDAPPVPRSLLKRLDQGIEKEWGESPRLADSQVDRLQRTISQGSRWVRGLPIAAAVAVAVVCISLINSAGTAYAWSSMLTALSRQGIVHFEQHGVTRWLSLSEGLVSESTAESNVLLDTNRKILLRRLHDGNVIERETLTFENSEAQNRLLFAFFAGDSRGAFSDNSTTVVDQGWEEVIIEGRALVQLNVACKSQDVQTKLHILVDPKTHLPWACDVSDAADAKAEMPAIRTSSRFQAFTYSNEIAATRVALVFPDDMPIADLTPADEIKTVSNDSPKSAATAVAAVDASKVDGDGSAAADPHADAPLMGAASKWRAVQIQPSATGNAVQDLDLLMTKLWEENNVKPVEPASDAELLRRVYLDLAGRTPSVNEVRDYLQNTSPDRYESLVNRLLNSPDHASHLAAKFRSFLIPEGVDLTNFGGVEAFEKWLAGRFQSNESYDKTVQSLLLAEGRLAQSGPLLFYSATKLEADQLAGRTARVFLGMRLECAQCHDHPFEPWTQEDFWGFAAFFARISRPRGKLETVSTVMQVRDVDRGEVMMPESTVPVSPKFLNADEVLTDEKANARRKKLTVWLTGSDNPYFARATANRVWSMLFGKGIVNPVDDFGVGNPPLSQELLDLLAGHFIKSTFNLKELFRVVALSGAYRLSSGSEVTDEARQAWFAQMNVKMLTAEQVYDCITVATMPSATQKTDMTGLVTRFGNVSRDEFLRDFRTPSGRSTEYQGGIPQALTLMNGTLIDSATGLASSGLLKSLQAPFFSRDQRIEILYFATLSRRPKPSENELLSQYITEDMSGNELREALSDVLWALLNSAEFTMNH
jgi:hypothetical protein